jgi:hypothetical protein
MRHCPEAVPFEELGALRGTRPYSNVTQREVGNKQPKTPPAP